MSYSSGLILGEWRSMLKSVRVCVRSAVDEDYFLGGIKFVRVSVKKDLETLE